jgi:hypothetical protein
MAVSMAKAREVCTKEEMELVESSFPPHVKKLTPARLRSKVARARKLGDKFSDLARKQNRASKEADRSPEKANVRTELKSRIFAETLQRFERRLEEVSSSV